MFTARYRNVKGVAQFKRACSARSLEVGGNEIYFAVLPVVTAFPTSSPSCNRHLERWISCSLPSSSSPSSQCLTLCHSLGRWWLRTVLPLRADRTPVSLSTITTCTRLEEKAWSNRLHQTHLPFDVSCLWAWNPVIRNAVCCTYDIWYGCTSVVCMQSKLCRSSHVKLVGAGTCRMLVKTSFKTSFLCLICSTTDM